MAVVALGSVKGSPGVTTAALSLAATWPSDRPVVVAELDQAGGDVGAWRGLPPEPGIVTLAAEARRGRGDRSVRLLDHCQELPGGLHVLIGSPSPAEMRTAVDVMAGVLLGLAADAPVDVLADCGRLNISRLAEPREASHHACAVGHVLRRADALVVVSRGQLADLSHLDASLTTLRHLNDRIGILLVGPPRWPVGDIASHFGVDAVGHLPHDASGADLVGGRATRGSVRRLPLLRAASAAAEQITAILPKLEGVHVDDAAAAAELRGIAAGVEVAP